VVILSSPSHDGPFGASGVKRLQSLGLVDKLPGMGPWYVILPRNFLCLMRLLSRLLLNRAVVCLFDDLTLTLLLLCCYTSGYEYSGGCHRQQYQRGGAWNDTGGVSDVKWRWGSGVVGASMSAYLILPHVFNLLYTLLNNLKHSAAWRSLSWMDLLAWGLHLVPCSYPDRRQGNWPLQL